MPQFGKKKLVIDIITLFPEFIDGYVAAFGILQKAKLNKQLDIRGVNLRSFASDARGTVDDRPYGGGVGMVLRPDVVYSAIGAAITNYGLRIGRRRIRNPADAKAMVGKQESRIKVKTRVILLSPRGKRFGQKDAVRLSKYEHLIFVSGRYEGVDERVSKYVDEELSIGDYVLMGGELPALVITEAVARLVPGVIGKMESTENESFIDNLLEYPQYTKPEVWRVGKKSHRVPKVLLTGHHGNIEAWRTVEAKKRTKKMRPDILIDQD